MADELILPLLGPNDDDDEDEDISTEDSEDDGLDNEAAESSPEGPRQRVNYDTSLPSMHSYLGNDLNELSGRVVLDEMSFINLPLLTLPGVVLVPGQTLPLQIEHPSLVAMLRRLVEADRTLGIVTSSINCSIGTTAEVRSFIEDDDGEGLSAVRLKAEGRQRFKVKETWRQMDGVLMAKVQILPELEVTHPLKLATYRHVNKTLPICSRWPRWVFQMYSPHELMRYIKNHLKNWCDSDNSTCTNVAPNNPCEFSYWVATNLPLDDAQRSEILAINCSVQRLRWELSLLEKYSVLCCSECKVKICERDDIFSMSVQGPQGTYVNPAGYVHDTLTVYKCENITLVGRSSTDHSWFPGFAWTICQCASCRSHMGWKFTATNKKLKPEAFWGLCRASLESGLQVEDGNDWKPTM